MSWIFAGLLAAYATTWTTLWFRGRVRWWMDAARRNPPPKARTAPAHLPRELRSLFAEADGLRLMLWRWHRDLLRMLVTDPDVAMGGMRTAEFRRVAMQSAQAVARCRRALRGLDGVARRSFVREETRLIELDELSRHLDRSANRIASSRALEAFEVGFVDQVASCMERAHLTLDAMLEDLERPGAHPYRAGGKAKTPSSSAYFSARAAS